jgi:hypothetical protein
MALAYGVGALVLWAAVSYFSGAAALGAALTFGVMIYAVHWIPNRTKNFLEDIPGVTTGMIDGIRDHTLTGLVPVLAVISLVYAIQLMVRAVRRRRQLRAEADLRQREQELAQHNEAEGQYQSTPYQAPAAYAAATPYTSGGGSGEYPTSVDNRYEEPYDQNADRDADQDVDRGRRNQSSDYEQTAQYPVTGATAVSANDDTTLLPTDPASRQSADQAARQEAHRETHQETDAAAADYPTAPLSPGRYSRSDEHQTAESQGADQPSPDHRTGSSAFTGAPTPGDGRPQHGAGGPSPSDGGPSHADGDRPPHADTDQPPHGDTGQPSHGDSDQPPHSGSPRPSPDDTRSMRADGGSWHADGGRSPQTAPGGLPQPPSGGPSAPSSQGPEPSPVHGDSSQPRGTGSSALGAGPSQSRGTGPSAPGDDPSQPQGTGASAPDRGRHLGPQASATPATHGLSAGFHQSAHISIPPQSQPTQSQNRSTAQGPEPIQPEQTQQPGQQYRERMDNPDHHFSVEPEQHPQAFLPSHFRIA